MGARGRIIAAAAGIAVIVIAAVVFLVADGGEDSPEQPAPAPSVTTGATATAPDAESRAKPKPRPGPLLESGQVEEISIPQGATVRFRVRSAVDDEVHVHGYDITKQLPAGETVNVRFVADVEGVFAIELHGSGEQIGELTVNP